MRIALQHLRTPDVEGSPSALKPRTRLNVVSS